MIAIARRNLLHDRLRLATAATGVVVSVVLVTCLAGMYVGCSRFASGLVDKSGADLWVVAPGTACVDRGGMISKRRLYQVMATPGVAWAEPLLVRFSSWRLPDGRHEVAQIVGLRRGSRLNIPWIRPHGPYLDVPMPGAVVIDERERVRFGPWGQRLNAGESAEILGHRATVTGFTSGIGSFTAIPYVFTDHDHAQAFTGSEANQTTFVLARVAEGYSVEQVRQSIQARLSDTEVLTTEAFSEITRRYWLFGTGVGTGIVFAALLGLVVGCVIVSQTIYASTVSRLPEYATLKAIGLGSVGLVRIVMEQAVLLGLAGYVVGLAVVTVVERQADAFNLTMSVPWWLAALMLLVTLTMCAVASLSSVRKVIKLPPASVFGGS